MGIAGLSAKGSCGPGPSPGEPAGPVWGMAMCSLLRQSLFWELRPEKRDTKHLHPFYLVFSIPTKEFDFGPKGSRLVSKTHIYTPPSSECPWLPLKMQVLRLHVQNHSLMVEPSELCSCGQLGSSPGDLCSHPSWRPLGPDVRNNLGAGNLGTCRIVWPRVACRPVGVPPPQTGENWKPP